MPSVIEDGVAYMLLLDGIPTVFVTSEAVDDAYVQTLGFTRAYPGLQFPTSLPATIDLRTGLLEGSGATIQIEDVDDTLPEIFGVNLDQSEPLLSTVPAGTTALGATYYSKHIGVEFVGPAGERRQCSCVPTWNVGFSHVGANQAAVTTAEASPVSDAPVTWAGRRFALYRLVLDADGNWPDLTDEDERLASRVYWGTLTGRGEHEGKTWSLQCAGMESWLGGSLGTSFTQAELPAEVGLTINEDAQEHVLIGVLDIVDLFEETEPEDDINAVRFTDPTTNTALLVGAESYEDVAAALDSFLSILESDNSYGVALTDIGESGLRYSTADGEDGVMVLWDRSEMSMADKYCLRLRIVAHHKVFKALGYDPLTQNSSVDPIDNFDKFGQFGRPAGDGTTAKAYISQWGIDYPNHFLGTFWSGDAVAMKAKLEGASGTSAEHTGSGGAERYWPTIYRGGCNVFDFGATNQVVKVIGYEPLFLSSSNAVPLPHDPDDSESVLSISGVGAVTHQGIAIFTGPFRDETDPKADVTKISLPARVAWRQNSDGSVATEDGRPVLAIYEWPDPRLYGFDHKQPSLWATWRTPPDDGEPLTVRSMLVLEHGAGSDVVGYVIARLLASTGAAGAWSGYGLGSGATLTTGPNDLGIAGIGDEEIGRFTDAETPAYSLGIPAEMIAVADEVGSLESALDAMADDDVNRCKAIVGKVVSARDVIKSLLSPSGWCVGLAGGRYGLFDPFGFQAPSLESGVITMEDIAADPGNPSSAIPTQKLRKWAPLDRIKLEARVNPITGSFARAETLRSQDQDAWYRKQSLEHGVDGSHLIHPTILGMKGASWLPEWLERWRQITRWWSRQHFECTLTVHASGATEFFPGAPVAITNAWLVNTAGAVYGVTQAPGYVLSSNLNCEEETLEITCIVDASSLRLYAPAARAVRYDQDEESEGYRLLVDDDYLDIRGNTGTFDVDGFLEPDWSTVGGDTLIEVFSSFDGLTWTGGIYGTIDSVSEAEGGHWLNLTGALTGETYLRDQHHIVVVREHADQSAAWPIQVFAAIGNKSGQYDGSTLSPKFKD